MKLKLVEWRRQPAPSIEVSDATFGREFNEALVHQVVTAYMAARPRRHQGAEDARPKCAAAASKPWRQKGTGQARAGSIRSPIWVGGGRAFAAQPRDFSQKVNRKMYRGAISAMLSELARQERLVVVDALELEAPKTKLLVAASSKELELDQRADRRSRRTTRSSQLASRNLPDVDVLPVASRRSGRACARHEQRARDGRRGAHARGEAGMSTPSRNDLMDVLIAPHVSEKSARVAERATSIVFRVRARRDQARDQGRRRADVRSEGRRRAGRERQPARRSASAVVPGSARTARRPTCGSRRARRSTSPASRSDDGVQQTEANDGTDQTKPTSPGRRFVVKPNRSHLHKGEPVHALASAQEARPARATTSAA